MAMNLVKAKIIGGHLCGQCYFSVKEPKTVIGILPGSAAENQEK
jgi:hypothetical protein